MEQNLLYKLVGALLEGSTHARALAKKLNTNHMTVARKLKELVDENVLDFKMEGKNKIYSIKKSLEARNYALMAETYKLNECLKKHPELRKIVDSIQKNPKVELAIIFGSYATGTVSKGSDIDLFVETRDRNLKRELEQLNSRLSVKIGTYDRSSPLIKEIEKNHVIVKGAELFYEKSRFFY